MKRILIVEDDWDLIRGLSICLKVAGYGVLLAQDGVAALSTAVTQHPDLILLDIGLPAGGGFWVLECLRKNMNTIITPVIVLTGNDPAAVKDKALAMGAAMFFQKPVDNEELLKAIRQHTGEAQPA